MLKCVDVKCTSKARMASHSCFTKKLMNHPKKRQANKKGKDIKLSRFNMKMYGVISLCYYNWKLVWLVSLSISIYIRKLFVCFVCNVEISQPFGKPFVNRSAVSWFHYVSTYGGKVTAY